MRWALLGIAAVFLAAPRAARAEVFHDADTLTGGNFRLGAEPEIAYDPNANHTDYLMYAHAGVGISDVVDAHFKVSFFDPQTYFGGVLAFELLRNGDGYPGIRLDAGGHYIARKPGSGHDYGGADGTLTISEDVADQVVYGGYDADFDLIPELHRVVPNQHLFLGVRLIVSDHLSFFIEGGYGLKRPDIPLYHYVSGGPALTF